MTFQLEVMEWAGVLKFRPRTNNEGQEEDRCIAVLIL
jgi:hypothetical protein